jgi:ribonuclease E
MLINASHPEENRVAIVVDGILSELDIEIAGQEQTKGNIYKAVVVRVETGLQAAFVDYGAEKLGFLQIGEIHPNIYPQREESKTRPRIAEILQRGQEILVQIVKEERGNKGAALTTFLSIPGRYMVLMPDSTTKGVSRKISEDSERKKLKRTMAELDLPEKMGYIVRTAGIGKDKEELKRDFDYLVRLYEGIVSRQDQIKAPAQLYQESNLVIRSIRDYFSTDMDEVLIDSHQVFQDTRDFFALVMPELKHMVKRHRERRPIFSRYQIEEQIDGLAKNQTALSSGGSIVIDQTEALVAIDVNSGKMASESGIEATALKTNLEAASEVGRQLRLRDLGGLVVIDFIDMRDRKNVREVEQQLRNALKDDKAKVSVGRISQFGLMEMSRQRLKPALSVGSYDDCPHCKGAGRIRSAEAQAVTLLRQAHTTASKGQIGQIDATVPVDVANYLLNQKRSTIIDLERQLNLRLNIQGSVNMLPGDCDLQLHKKEKEQSEARQILPVSHANQIDVALAAQQEEQSIPAPDQEEANTETEQPQPVSTEAPDVPKKRRRRRRKKPASAEQQSGQTNTSDSEELNTEVTATAPTTEEKIATAEPETPSEGEKTEEKPKRRSRRPARRRTPSEEEKPAAGTVQTVTTETEKAVDPAVEVANATPQETQNAPEDKIKPTRTRRPRRAPRKKPVEVPSGETITQPENTQLPAPAPSPEQAEVDKPAEVTEEKPQRKPRRAPRKKIESTEVNAAAVETEEKPKRRPRKTVQKVAEETPADQNPSQGEEVTQKPQRKTRRTAKKTEEVGQQPEADGSATIVDNTPPKPRPTRARRTKAVDTAATPSTSTEATAPEDKTNEEKPKRRTRRTVKKTTEPAVTPEPTVDIEKSEQEKPKRKPRRTTKKETTTEAPPSEQQNNEQEEPAPKTPRKRTPRKKVDETTD